MTHTERSHFFRRAAILFRKYTHRTLRRNQSLTDTFLIVFPSPHKKRYSRLPKKTSSLAAHKKRKALADVIREMESEQKQVKLPTLTDKLDHQVLTHAHLDRKQSKHVF